MRPFTYLIIHNQVKTEPPTTMHNKHPRITRHACTTQYQVIQTTYSHQVAHRHPPPYNSPVSLRPHSTIFYPQSTQKISTKADYTPVDTAKYGHVLPAYRALRSACKQWCGVPLGWVWSNGLHIIHIEPLYR